MEKIQFLLMVVVVTWYSQACRFLKLRHHTHHTHSYYEKSNIIERTIQYIKKIEQNALMIIFHVKKITVLEHVRNWFNLFVDIRNSMIIFAK